MSVGHSTTARGRVMRVASTATRSEVTLSAFVLAWSVVAMTLTGVATADASRGTAPAHLRVAPCDCTSAGGATVSGCAANFTAPDEKVFSGDNGCQSTRAPPLDEQGFPAAVDLTFTCERTAADMTQCITMAVASTAEQCESEWAALSMSARQQRASQVAQAGNWTAALPPPVTVVCNRCQQGGAGGNFYLVDCISSADGDVVIVITEKCTDANCASCAGPRMYASLVGGGSTSAPHEAAGLARLQGPLIPAEMQPQPSSPPTRSTSDEAAARSESGDFLVDVAAIARGAGVAYTAKDVAEQTQRGGALLGRGGGTGAVNATPCVRLWPGDDAPWGVPLTAATSCQTVKIAARASGPAGTCNNGSNGAQIAVVSQTIVPDGTCNPIPMLGGAAVARVAATCLGAAPTFAPDSPKPPHGDDEGGVSTAWVVVGVAAVFGLGIGLFALYRVNALRRASERREMYLDTQELNPDRAEELEAIRGRDDMDGFGDPEADDERAAPGAPPGAAYGEAAGGNGSQTRFGHPPRAGDSVAALRGDSRTGSVTSGSDSAVLSSGGPSTVPPPSSLYEV